MNQKVKDILFVAGLLAAIACVFLGIWLGDEYHNVYYVMIPLGIIAFGGMILIKGASGKKAA